MTAHDFSERLAYSHSQADAPYWGEVYRQVFPDMVHSLDLRHDGWHQRAGRDRVIILSSGRPIYIDEKVRTRDYGDFLVEVWSQYPSRGAPPYPRRPGAVPGWAVEPKDCDFLAYAIEPTQVCYILPFLGLRAAWVKHGAIWRAKASNRADGFRWAAAPNGRYQTISITMPTDVLRACVNDALTVCWGLAGAA